MSDHIWKAFIGLIGQSIFTAKYKTFIDVRLICASNYCALEQSRSLALDKVYFFWLKNWARNTPDVIMY